MKRVAVIAVAWLLTTGTSAIEVSDAIDPSGIWRTVEIGALASGVMYFDFQSSGQCRQIAFATFFGFSRSTIESCTWSLEGTALKVRTVGKDGSHQEVTFEIVGHIASEMTLRVSDESRTWQRRTAIPGDLEADLESNR